MDKRRVVVTGAAGRIGRTVCADAVVHLAADPDPEATWDSVLPSNIEGPYQVATAAVACDVRRLVLASSLHAVGGYPEGDVGQPLPVRRSQRGPGPGLPAGR